MLDLFSSRNVLVRPFLALFCILLFGGGLSGCYSPDFVYRLDASAPDSAGFWRQGRQVVTRTVDSVQVAVSYGRTTDEGHKFQLAFVNRSRDPVTVVPTDIYAVVTRKLKDGEHAVATRAERSSSGAVPRWDTAATRTARDTLSALDPERKLLAIDRERSRREERAENDATADALFLTLDAVSEIATVAQSPEERTADATEDREYQAQRAKEDARRQRIQSRLNRERSQWAQSALRRTTIAPDGRVTGFVAVPVASQAARLVLHVQLEDHSVTVPYVQTRYDPDRRARMSEQDTSDSEHERHVLSP